MSFLTFVRREKKDIIKLYISTPLARATKKSSGKLEEKETNVCFLLDFLYSGEENDVKKGDTLEIA